MNRFSRSTAALVGTSLFLSLGLVPAGASETTEPVVATVDQAITTAHQDISLDDVLAPLQVEDDHITAEIADLEVRADRDPDAGEISIIGEHEVRIGLPVAAETHDEATTSNSDDRVVYLGGEGVASVTAEVTDEGVVRAHTVIEDDLTSERFEYAVSISAPADRHVLPDGAIAFIKQGVSFEDATDEDLLGLIDTPWAVDANGNDVPTWFELDDDRVIQVVAHQDADVAYPVTADPAWFIPAGALLIRGGMAVWKAARAVKFVTIGKIRKGVYTTDKGFDTFDQFKRAHGTKANTDWHHIVEQKHVGRFAKKAVHNPNNLVQIPREIHQKCINSIMNAKNVSGPGFASQKGLTMRQTVDRAGSWKSMHNTGIAILKFCGVNL